jgi:hypothetical protein
VLRNAPTDFQNPPPANPHRDRSNTIVFPAVNLLSLDPPPDFKSVTWARSVDGSPLSFLGIQQRISTCSGGYGWLQQGNKVARETLSVLNSKLVGPQLFILVRSVPAQQGSTNRHRFASFITAASLMTFHNGYVRYKCSLFRQRGIYVFHHVSTETTNCPKLSTFRGVVTLCVHGLLQ